MKPFVEIKISESVVTRTFSCNTPEEDLKWHWDPEDRIIHPLNENDWMFQLDNQLPMRIYRSISIPTGVLHRLIRGSGDLILQITKRNESIY